MNKISWYFILIHPLPPNVYRRGSSIFRRDFSPQPSAKKPFEKLLRHNSEIPSAMDPTHPSYNPRVTSGCTVRPTGAQVLTAGKSTLTTLPH